MKNFVFVCVVFIAFVSVVYSEAINNKDEQSFTMKRRQIEEDDRFPDLEVDDNNDEEIETVRRQSSKCEPCGIRRLSCCFPNLCQRRPGKTSKCYKVTG
jgi:hypothetical protein